jgi:hypothetical protein
MYGAADIARRGQVSGQRVVEDVRPLQPKAKTMYVAADPVADSLIAQMGERTLSEQIMYGKSWHKMTSCVL